MSTIKERLKNYCYYPGSIWAEDDIVNPWDAAIEAMKDAEAQLVSIESVCNSFYNGTRGELDTFLDEAMPEIRRGKLKAAIARMEGDII